MNAWRELFAFLQTTDDSWLFGVFFLVLALFCTDRSIYTNGFSMKGSKVGVGKCESLNLRLPSSININAVFNQCMLAQHGLKA